MSGNYPNGGYRNQTARELSMPSQANPPGVTGTVGPGNTLKPPPLQGELQVPNRTSSKGGGIESFGGTSSGKGSNTITIDRNTFENRLSDDSKLTPDARERLRGLHRIDLNPSEYRVNGRGYAMRMAADLARKILGVGKRIPKGLYQELLNILLDEILRLMDRQVVTKEEKQLNPDWEFISYGEQGMTAGQAIELADDSDPTTHNQPIPMGWVTPPVTLMYDPYGIGNYLQFGWKPLPVQPPYYAPIGGQAVPQTKPTKTLGIWRKNYEAFPLAPWSYSYFSYVAGFYSVQATPGPLILKAAFAFPGNLNAPYPWGKGEGGNAPPNDPPNPSKKDDVKISLPGWMNTALDVANMATEWGDSIDCIYSALPSYKQYGRSYADKLQRISEALDKVDWSKAAACWATNQVTDPAWGNFFGWVDKARKQRPGSGGTSQDPRPPDVQIEFIEG